MTKISELRTLILKSKSEIFSFEELENLGYSKRWLKYAIKKLREEGLLFRLKKGLYSKTKPENMDRIKLANLLIKGYVGLMSAAYVYGWTDELPFTIYVLTKSESKRMKIGNVEIIAIAVKDRFFGSHEYKGYLISTKAKTIFDLIWYHKLFNLEKVKKVIREAKLGKKDIKELKDMIKSYHSERFNKKLEVFSNELQRIGIKSRTSN